MSASMTFGLMSSFDKLAVNSDFLAGISIFLPPLRPFLPRGTGAESPNTSHIYNYILFKTDIMYIYTHISTRSHWLLWVYQTVQSAFFALYLKSQSCDSTIAKQCLLCCLYLVLQLSSIHHELIIIIIIVAFLSRLRSWLQRRWRSRSDHESQLL